MALSPLDGRYDRFVKELMPFFSEFGLIRYRVLIEFSKEAHAFLNSIIDNFCIDDAKEQRCSTNPEIAKVSEFFHFGCTSEDINNLSHALARKEGINRVMFPVMIDICRALCSLATQNSGYPMLVRTHGQVKILGKFAGAVGNYNANVVAYPEGDWPKVAEELLDSWTMPHKINPIDFENSDGNLCQANSILSGVSVKLPISRLQCDLTDSTVLRNLGMGLGHSLLAYKATMRGISKVQVLAEPIQTVMRRYGIPERYEKLKELTRGQAVTKDSMQQFIDDLDLPEEVRSKLSKLTPHSYTGLAEDLTIDIEKWPTLFV
ncbi:hypothetical protein SORBI_3001G392500 [Sorghum bicolor]|uniref:Adenylosuccinate lyase n=1 Tax=Sorghum bicolor TaxID=4558 RepID=A0A1B6QNK6_SORBI|nr:hypothetical protein SORBI_3001G392500 [Sorghum bicolor]